MENIERVFQEEIREKKRIGSGVYSRRGKGVKHGISGALRTPYHYMTNKEKKKLNGEVETYSMYETVLEKNEFLTKDLDLQKLMLTRWREIYDNDLIKEAMGMTNKAYHDLVNELELPKKRRSGRPVGSKATATPKPKKTEEIKKPVEIKEKVSIGEVKPIIITNGLHLEYNGNYNAEDINKILMKLQLLVDGEENKFNLSISLSEST